MLTLSLCPPHQDDSWQPSVLHGGIPPTGDNPPLISPMLLFWNGLFNLVEEAHLHNRVEVSDWLLLNPVPAYMSENKASFQVLHSHWYSEHDPVSRMFFSGSFEVWFIGKQIWAFCAFFFEMHSYTQFSEKVTWAFSLHGKSRADSGRGHSSM